MPNSNEFIVYYVSDSVYSMKLFTWKVLQKGVSLFYMQCTTLYSLKFDPFFFGTRESIRIGDWESHLWREKEKD